MSHNIEQQSPFYMPIDQFNDHMASNDTVELRGMIPRQIVDVLDAVSQARRMARSELAVEVLAAWDREQIHISTVVQRVTRGHGRGSES